MKRRICLKGGEKMRITDIISDKRPSLSFEVFPPKSTDSFDSVMESTMKIADLMPSYMSVTYGAGGGTSRYTADIASHIKARGVTALAHLSCISSSPSEIDRLLSDLEARGIENILALRGDKPKDAPIATGHEGYKYASELITRIKEKGSFTVGGACYPEGHPESESLTKDIDYLKAKVDAGCDFLTTQMFFDNDILYNFMYRLLRRGVDVPVVAGIMPLTSKSQIERITAISGNALPQRFLRIVDRYAGSPEAMKQAGIAFAIEQVIDLYANGINAVHIYSMNKPDVAKAIRDGISEIIK